MKFAVLSGKGGTGKTLVSVNLAAVAKKSTYIDCDVEEPNGHLFFRPENVEESYISVDVPSVNMDLCNGCRKCVDFCKFNALAYIREKLIIFEEICHSCGGCMILCPEAALSERKRVIGKIQKGKWGQVSVHTGILNIGEVSGVPIIQELLSDKSLGADELVIIDSPPGSGCLVMDSIKDADYCILVAEPTIFGVHNLKMVLDLVNLFQKPFGLVINKYVGEYSPLDELCREKGIELLERIPYDHELGKLASNAKIAAVEDKKYNDLFNNLLDKITGVIGHEAITNT